MALPILKMDPNATLDPQQIHQILVLLQEISSKLDLLQSSNTNSLGQLADKVLDNAITYHLLTQ